MSRSSTLPTYDDPPFEQFPDYQALLEEHWRRQVATITELSYAFLSPAPEDLDDRSGMHRLQVAARLIAAARQQLQETEAALAQIRDGGHGICGRCGAPAGGTPVDRALRTVPHRLPSPAHIATESEEKE